MTLTFLSVFVLVTVLIIVLCCPVNGIDCSTGVPNMPFNESCGDNKCFCSKSKQVALCADWGANLTYIPRLLHTVHTLIFRNNSLPNMSRGTFQNVSAQMKKLCLIHNGILHMANDTFVDLGNLLEIGITDNHNISLSDLENTFASLPTQHRINISLTNIGLTEYVIREFLENLFLKKVELMDFSRNSFEVFDLDVFYNLTALTELRVSSCRIRYINILLGHRTLEELDLSNNRIGDQPPCICFDNGRESSFPMLKKLYLRQNLLYNFTAANWDCLSQLHYLDISKNFITVLQTNAFTELRSLTELRLSDMYMGIKEIQKDALNKSNLMLLWLDGNSIKFRQNMVRNMFVNCPNVQTISLSRNNFYYIHDFDILQMFSPMKNLTHLTIESAYMRLPEGFLALFPNLTTLNLASNRNSIYDIGVFFKNTKNLKDVSLMDNAIQVVSQESFSGSNMGSVQLLNLANNPFSCSCEMLWFRNAIDKDGHIGKIKLQLWPERYSCAENQHFSHKSYPLFINFKPSTYSCKNILVITLICAVSFLVLILSLVIVVYKYRWYIAYWAYKLKARRSSPEIQPLLDNEGAATREGVAYDGYVIYSDEDRNFVHNDLIQLLEVRFDNTLHIWDRDAWAGQDKVTVIADAIYASKHVVAVISEQVLDDTWFQFQLNVALDRQLDMKREFLILILLEDINYEKLSKFWCVMLTRLLCTRWCSDESNVKRRVFEQQLEQHFRRSQPRT